MKLWSAPNLLYSSTVCSRMLNHIKIKIIHTRYFEKKSKQAIKPVDCLKFPQTNIQNKFVSQLNIAILTFFINGAASLLALMLATNRIIKTNILSERPILLIQKGQFTNFILI